ncbi:MAG TPA: GAF domain-containing protein, partial [Chloroflexota bacterium]|nr:GAF domain-containing protein [Chloroflexota bacterium]
MLHELRRAGFEPRWQHVATEPNFLARLAPPPDIILADYTLPQFDALGALRCVQERAPDIPLIVVTGALSDEAAVACLKQGAADYLLKDRLGRLGEAVRHALAEEDLRVQHRQAHDALRASEERFRALSEHASDLVGILDADGTYRYASPSHRRILGYAPAEVQGRTIFELMHPDDVPHTQAAFAALLQSPGAMEAAEFRMRHADGSWRTLEGVGTNRLHDPAVRGMIANAHDITERKRADAERTVLLTREQEARQVAERAAERTQRLQSVTAALARALTSDQVADVIITQGLAAFEATQGSVVVLSDDGTVLQMLRLVGYPPEVFEAWREFPAETRAPIADAVREREVLVLTSREEHVTRYPHLAGIQAPGGTGAMIVLPLIVGDRAIGGIGLTLPEERHVDAEERAFTRALADLCAQALDRGRLYDAEQRARLEAETATVRLQAIQSVTDAALAHLALEDLLPRVLDRLTTALAVDNASVLLLSENGENLVLHMARGPEEQVAGQVRVPLGHGIAGHIAATRAPLIVDDLATIEVVNPFLRGTIHSLMGVPLVVEDRVIGVVHVGSRAPRHFTADDVHLLQLVADRIALAIGHAHLYAAERRAHTQAVNAVQERDVFLSVAAHELKTPVTSLCGFAQTLLHVMKGETRIDAPQVRRALHHIDTQSMKLDGLIAQLLDLSRIEAGQLSLDTQVVDLTAVVQGVVAAAQARTSAHTLVLNTPAPIAARLDPLRIEQVLVNLVNNAIKYSPDGGTIDIAATQYGDTAQVAVRDHGLGIPPEHREHIFDRFYQAHARSHRSGMGLGLYISRQIVDLHG